MNKFYNCNGCGHSCTVKSVELDSVEVLKEIERVTELPVNPNDSWAEGANWAGHAIREQILKMIQKVSAK